MINLRVSSAFRRHRELSATYNGLICIDSAIVSAFGCPFGELQEEGGGDHQQSHLNAIILDCDGRLLQLSATRSTAIFEEGQGWQERR